MKLSIYIKQFTQIYHIICIIHLYHTISQSDLFGIVCTMLFGSGYHNNILQQF